MSSSYLYFAIFLCAVFTFLTRILAFLVFSQIKPNPTMDYLKRHLPVMIMTILIFYSLSGTNWDHTKGIPEISAIALSALLHLKKKNALLSIFLSTAFYMILIQSIF
ncbi:MAG: branched-chain amino acid ABC transporter [Flexistipes sinusarabici]|uniref:Branched-chain amino acid ABC transporter n=1 Tax=Flexistipes sinusarabici TaxID=2352 RepID=A0A5D0MRA1_FLESI|nr:AzlD domain-containing protein [Flexistipes sinusarabici]TYB33389.1 MAG: branched-chain amino acid ABC transporter [Flexistipes sinusarabici]